MRRMVLPVAGASLLVLAWLRIPAVRGGQSAVPLSREGQEDLTFWVNHNGLSQVDVLGEVGFGDMARILMRRRANAGHMRTLRDRFTFRVQKMDAIETPDVFKAEAGASGLKWVQAPSDFVIAADHTFNLPLIVRNGGTTARSFEASFRGTTAESRFGGVEVPPGQTSGFFLRVVESQPGQAKGKLTLHSGSEELSTEISLDVRRLARLRVELLDERGRPGAARVYLTGSDGLAYAPHGSSNRYTAMSAEPYFHAQGTFELDMPAGKTLIEATRGQEYELAAQTVELHPGQMNTVRVQLSRWANLAAEGWFSSDAHIHANYTATHHQVVSTQDVQLQVLAEDLNNANMMVANSGGAFIHDAQHFEGKPHRLSTEHHLMYWNEEMRNGGVYGHMSFFNLKQLVHPLYTGFRDTPNWEDYPPNYTQAEAARRQGGAVTYVHPTMEPTFDGTNARELPVDLALGQVDAMDVLSNTDDIAAMEVWYRLLNCGFRLSISAGTDSFTNVADHYTAGGGRVYVHAPRGPQSSEWVQNYKRGYSFASNGPVMTLTVNGRNPGDDVKIAAAPANVRVKAAVRTNVPLERVEVVVNGKPAISRAVKGEREIAIDEPLTIERSSWIALRALGPWHRLILNDIQTFAHTSPVYVHLGEQKIGSREDAKFYAEWIDKLIERIRQRGRFSSDERREEVIRLCRRAQQIYLDIERRGPGD
jgi:hypothetical protein